MYNLRYHIASLVSVFLALAVGLVLGGLIVQRGTFDNQGQALVEGLRKEFSDLRTENRELGEEREQLDALAADLVEGWASDRLSGRTIVVFTNTGRTAGLSAIREAVEDAGGTAAFVTAAPHFGMGDEDLRASVSSLAADPEEPESSIATSLAAEWAQPSDDRPLTDALVATGALTIEGLEPGTPVAGYIDVSAPDGVADSSAILLGRRLAENAVVAIGAESPGGDSGIAAAAASSGLSAMDTIGTELGRYTLVALLSGAEPGFYGTSGAAEALYPPLPER